MDVKAVVAAKASAHQQRRRRALRLLLLRGTTKERDYLTVASLQDPLQSAWQQLYDEKLPGSFIAAVSLPPTAFELLLAKFAKFYQLKWRPGQRGRPPKLRFLHAVLGCVLHFYTAAVEQKTLCEIFGSPPATLSSVLARAEIALELALNELPDAAVRYPTKQTQVAWAAAVKAREPLVEGVWGFVDGKNYRVQEPSGVDLQNAHYNGWLHSVLVTGTLCYGCDGTLVWAKHNYPGSWNDGEISFALQEKLADPDMTVQGTGVAADTAFPVSKGMRGRIITPIKDGDLERAPAKCRLGVLAMSNAITSLRQAAEWGMGSAPQCYRQQQLPLPCHPIKRGKRINNIYRLFNFLVRQTGISQIRTVFM
ncbi:hypothetical protein PHYSODRAFT_522767 [Phytophthora sojae]|uniref:DDE Tnp4 domain-containing protein n=1 Tax=Phytophthora sojae (strain P6497) TaxID=1094619 RepID=G5A3J6_PHYSP|nr:hypothetical protein PHYSODRAFT_522767 [Phytophthora sojae]EGZ10212.1 hypothetical protein PHYSODRAFT_522767 [Phytophthora sojae]|eukprot:XP_009535073.1 hypothetical protein PHYSODRAFT_522767 [Phytophthora sojae]